MPADKPRGSFSTATNVATYPHAADLDTAFEFDRTTIGDAFTGGSYTSEIGGIGVSFTDPGGSSEARAAPHLIGNDGGRQDITARPVAAGAQTYELGFVLRTTAGTNDAFIGVGDVSGNFNFVQLENDGANFNNFLAGGSSISLNGGSALSVGDFVHIFGTTVGSTATTNWRVYVNGTLAGTSTGTTGANADFGAITSVGGQVNPEGNWSLVFRRYYSAVLSVSEMEQNALSPTWEQYAVVGATLSGGAVVDVAGTAAAVSTASGGLSVSRAVAGQADAISTGAGAASVGRSLSGAASSASTAAGAVAVARALSGQAVAVSTGAGDTTVSANVTFAGAASAVSAGAGSLEVARPLAGAAAAVATGAGALAATRALSGQAVAVSVGAGDTTVTASGVTDFAGQAVATSTAAGGLTVARPVAGAAAATSAPAGALAVARALAGQAVAVSTGAGDTTVSANVTFAGQASSSSATAGGITVSRALAARAAGAAVGAGALVVDRPISGRSVIISSAAGDLTGDLALKFDPDEQASTLGLALTRIMGIYDVVETLRTDGRIPNVIDGWLDIDNAMGLEKPVVCVFPSPQQPPPITETISGSYREDIEVTLVGYIDAGDTMEARVGLGQLETLLMEVLLADRRRDGWSFDTIKSQGTQTDEGLKVDGIEGGIGGQFAALMTGVRISSFPLEQGDEGNVAHADFYLAAAGTVSIADASVVTEIAPGQLTLGSASKFIVGPSGRVRYTGSRTRTFRVEGQVSLRQDLASAADVDLYLMVGGTEVARTKATGRMPDNETRAFQVGAMLDVAFNDELSLGIDAASTGTLNVETLQITAIPKLA